MTDSDLYYEINEKKSALTFLKDLQRELDPQTYLDELNEEIERYYDDIKATCEYIAEKVKVYTAKQVIDDLNHTPAFEIDGSEHETVWQELVAEYQGNGSILQEIWQDTLDSTIQSYIKNLEKEERIALMLSTREGDESLDWWRSSPDDAPSIANIEENLNLNATIEIIRSIVETAIYDVPLERE